MKKTILILLLLLCSSIVFADVNYEITVSDETFMNGAVVWHVTCKSSGAPLSNKTIHYALKDDGNSVLKSYGDVTTDENGNAVLEMQLPTLNRGEYFVSLTIDGKTHDEPIDLEPVNYTLVLNNDIILPNESIEFSGTYNYADKKIEVALLDINKQLMSAYAPDIINHAYSFSIDRPLQNGTYYLETNVEGKKYLYPIHVVDQERSYDHEKQYVIEHASHPDLPNQVMVTHHDGTTETVSVTWDNGNFSVNEEGIYQAVGTYDNQYSIFTYLVIKKDYDLLPDGIVDNETTRTFYYLIPKSGFKSSLQKKAVLKKLDEQFDALSTSPKFSDLETLLANVSLTINALDKEDALDYSRQIKELIEKHMKNFSKSDSANLIGTYINNTYAAYYDNLTAMEQINYSNDIQSIIDEYLMYKTTFNLEEINKSNTTNVINNTQSVLNIINSQIDNNIHSDSLTIRLSAGNSIVISEEAAIQLNAKKADMHITFELGSIHLPSLSANELNFSLDKTDAPIGTTKNGIVSDVQAYKVTTNSNDFKMQLPVETLDSTLMVGYYENHQWTKLDYSIKDNEVIFNGNKQGVYGIMSFETSFNDLEDWVKPMVTSLTGKGIISGQSADAFGPNDTMTRAEFITILIKALDLNEITTDTFNDESDWYSTYLSIAKDYDLNYGTKNNNFRANDPITREEIASLISKAFEIRHMIILNETSTPFSDHSSIADDAKVAVYAMKANNIISGYNDNTFNPKGTATRGEAAAILYNFLEIK